MAPNGPDEESAKTKLTVHQPCTAPIDTGAINGVALIVFNTRQPLHQSIKRLLFHCDANTTVRFGLQTSQRYAELSRAAGYLGDCWRATANRRPVLPCFDCRFAQAPVDSLSSRPVIGFAQRVAVVRRRNRQWLPHTDIEKQYRAERGKLQNALIGGVFGGIPSMSGGSTPRSARFCSKTFISVTSRARSQQVSSIVPVHGHSAVASLTSTTIPAAALRFLIASSSSKPLIKTSAVSSICLARKRTA